MMANMHLLLLILVAADSFDQHKKRDGYSKTIKRCHKSAVSVSLLFWYYSVNVEPIKTGTDQSSGDDSEFVLPPT